MRRSLAILGIVTVVTALVVTGLIIRHRHAVVDYGSARVVGTYDGTTYCLAGTLRVYGDGHSSVSIKNCSKVGVLVPVYNKTNNTFASSYPIKRFNFAPGGHAEFDIDSARPRLLATISIDGTELPISIGLGPQPAPAHTHGTNV